ncbi:MAG TPA: DUF547 domain-containing protein [Miltoncostaeaceae bacterium]|nr:DUF547 domain-containing protein [Miltoncostaeaceae bacterium]
MGDLDTVSAVASRLRAPRRVARPTIPERRGGAFDHSRYARALSAAAPDGWRVDYGTVARSSDLAAYRRDLAAADPSSLARDEQLAFWINAYNASLLGLVAERMPVRSVLEIDGAFTRVRFRVGRSALTADEIEHGIVRRFGDARVHFGLNRASVGCPPLRAFAGPGLGGRLEENGRRYLADEQRGARGEGERVLLSRIFQWFAGDFAPVGTMPSALGMLLGALRPARVLPAVRGLLPEGLREARRVGFLDYDWAVNGG